MAEEIIQDYYQRRVGSMRNERSSFISHWQELSEFVTPRKGRFLVSDRNKGDRRFKSIINSKASHSHKVARAGLMSGSMNPSRPWFTYETPDPDMMDYQPVKEWLYKVELIMRAIYNGGNLYNMAPSFLGELLLFGVGCMSHVDDFDDVARFYTHTVGSYMWGQNSRLVIDTMAREFQWTVSQIVGEFAEKGKGSAGMKNISISVQQAYDKGNYDQWYPVTHFVGPNKDHDMTRAGSQFKRFESVYYEPGISATSPIQGSVDRNKILRKRGFDYFPAYCTRWDVTEGDIYATDCPGMTALGDIKGLQIQEKRKAQAVDKMVNPPLKGPASLRNVPVNSLPGGLTIYDDDSTKNGLMPIYEVKPQVGEMRIDIKAVEQRIDTNFYVDMFLAISNMEGIQPKNEFELSQRNQERLLQLGPVLEQLHGEFLTRLNDNTFNACVRHGIFPPAPPELQGMPLKVNYISSLAMAQRSVATGNIERWAGFIGGLKKAQLTDGKKFNGDHAIEEYARIGGVPPKLVVPDDIVAKQRADEAKQQKVAMAAEMAKTGTEAVKNLGATATNPDDPNAVTSLAHGIKGALTGKK